MKTIKDLKVGDYIAFPFSYDRTEPHSIEVAEIVSINEDRFGVLFLYGYKSVNETVLSKDIIAIGNQKEGKDKISGWGWKLRYYSKRT